MFNIPVRGGRPQNLRIQIPQTAETQTHIQPQPQPQPQSNDYDYDSQPQRKLPSLQLQTQLQPQPQPQPPQINPRRDRRPPDEKLYTNPRDLPLEALGSSGLETLAQNKEIIDAGNLGSGAGGWVSKCEIRPTNSNLASKIFAIKTLPPGPNKIELTELSINERCDSPYIVKYYGAFRYEGNICIAMEYMDSRSLHDVYNKVKSLESFLNERVLSEIARSILMGLQYLNAQRILHRDIKPSNILFNSKGQIKLCDLGISRDLDGTLASTFVGTRNYMAPERLSGQRYGVNCETWSVGITILEAAMGEHPVPETEAYVANYDSLPSPQLKDIEGVISWSDAFKDFISLCLRVNVNERPSPTQMLKHPWITKYQEIDLDMEAFIRRVWR